MPESSGDIARRLAARAADVCRHYLPNGSQVGNYWIVGDARGARGRSLYVRLAGPPSGEGAAGKWSDAATGEHGDLLDLIAEVRRLSDHRDVLDEARRFLNLAPIALAELPRDRRADRRTAAQRLFAASSPIEGTLAETYLRARGVDRIRDLGSLRFHPRCFYRSDGEAAPRTSPAMIAAVTDLAGAITGVQRTYLARDGSAKAPLPTPRRALGNLAGDGVRFGATRDVMLAGEGIETVLSLRCVLPAMPMVAALSAQHLGALRVPATLKRLYIAADRDEAGARAAETLRRRAVDHGVEARILLPIRNDFNDDLNAAGRGALAASLFRQLGAADRAELVRPG